MEDVDAKLTHVGSRWCQDINAVYEVVPEDPETGAPDRDDSNKENPGWLGRGTYGIVRRRRRVGDAQTPAVAVKEIRKEPLQQNSDVLVHTLVELSVLKCVQHRGCIRLVDLLHSKDTLYIITSLFGTTLYNCIATDGAFSLPSTAIVLKQLLETLSYLHTQVMIVHRDVKPENILINPKTLSIKLIDFGLAKFIGKPKTDPQMGLAPSPGISVTPGTCTTAYASLEVIEGMLMNGGSRGSANGKKWNSGRSGLTKVDVYATGVVCYAMIFTCLPFPTAATDSSERGLMHVKSMMQRGVKFPAKAQQFPTQYALTFIMHLMHVNPEARPTAAEALSHPYLYNVSTPAHCKTPGAGLGPAPIPPSQSGGGDDDASPGDAGEDVPPANTPVKTLGVQENVVKVGPPRKSRGVRAGKKHNKGKKRAAAAAAAEAAAAEAGATGVGGGDNTEGGTDAQQEAESGGGPDMPTEGGEEGGGVPQSVPSVVPSVGVAAVVQPGRPAVDYTAAPSPMPRADAHCDFKDGWGSIMQTIVADEDDQCDEETLAALGVLLPSAMTGPPPPVQSLGQCRTLPHMPLTPQSAA